MGKEDKKLLQFALILLIAIVVSAVVSWKIAWNYFRNRYQITCPYCNKKFVDNNYIAILNSQIDHQISQNAQTVATDFFNALKNRNIQEATYYCEPQIIDDRGFITLSGLSYDSTKICSMIASRMDDQWTLANDYLDKYNDDSYTSFVISNDRMKNGPGTIKENGEYFSQGKKVKSTYCLVLNMHKVNGEWKIFRLSSAQPIKTY